MFNDEVTLITKNEKQDKYKNVIYDEERITILCREESITRAEFYNAGREGHKPSVTLVIHPYEYFRQQELEYKGQRYRVIRTFSDDIEELELVCEVME
ncbi:phage head closure protein [Aerococcaceae bacterium DSM 111022]|nr:phage head closure protein [Aerococcaceae bacterium DSM 111022]